MLEQKLKALEELQKVDVSIAELDRSGAENPKRLAEIEDKLEAARSIVQSVQVRIDDLEKQKRDKETELADFKTQMKKREARLAEQRTTREYAQVARASDIDKKQMTKLQEDIAELAKAAEEARVELETKSAAQRGQSEKLVAEASVIQKAISELAESRQALLSRREATAAKVDATMLRRYETIRKKRTNPVAAVVGGACKGCNMNLPPQMYNELRTAQKMEVCPSCGRMIYAVEAFAPPAVQP